ncbi:hypothetical protein GN244_ATG20300 [Phytophthora infestans]|uniref:Reverse transcriptase domain-containing protein n=1 Tax=Phytophthora infestans TaxID=4787 RepID=A0A833S656_PHYIN|nr:hypothetical protein GN244_ATG20300 [Phytophthora infestans]
MTKETLDAVNAVLEQRARDAPSIGLRKIRYVRLNTLRFEFGNDHPAQVAPLQLGIAPRIVRRRIKTRSPMRPPRMDIDTRSVNDKSDAMPWPKPLLEIIVGELEGATVFFRLDWFRGYWQLPLHPDSQEYFTFVTHRSMYTPTRVPMGSKDSSNGAAGPSAGALQEVWTQATCQKSQWCGKMTSAHGVHSWPNRIQGLVNKLMSRSAADLQQFLCVVNPRTSDAISWRENEDEVRVEDETTIEAVRAALLKMVSMAHPNPENELRPEELRLPLEAEQHRPLAFLSGRFSEPADSSTCCFAQKAFDWIPINATSLYGVDSTMARYQADMLQRMRISLMAFCYVIEHVPGDQNSTERPSAWFGSPLSCVSRRRMTLTSNGRVKRRFTTCRTVSVPRSSRSFSKTSSMTRRDNSLLARIPWSVSNGCAPLHTRARMAVAERQLQQRLWRHFSIGRLSRLMCQRSWLDVSLW